MCVGVEYLRVFHIISLELCIVVRVKVEGLIVGAGLGVCLAGVEVVDIGGSVKCRLTFCCFLGVGVTLDHLERGREQVSQR